MLPQKVTRESKITGLIRKLGKGNTGSFSAAALVCYLHTLDCMQCYKKRKGSGSARRKLECDYFMLIENFFLKALQMPYVRNVVDVFISL